MDSKFRTYQKITTTEIRPYEESETLPAEVGISDHRLKFGSPKKGDMICRDINNPDDLWLIDQEYFERHYMPVD